MTGTALQNCFETDLTLHLHQQIVFFASSVVNEMSQLQEFSIFESRGNHRDYVPHSRLERLQFFCKNSWAWILIVLLLIQEWWTLQYGKAILPTFDQIFIYQKNAHCTIVPISQTALMFSCTSRSSTSCAKHEISHRS